jgi:hypothetical protein
MDAPDRYVGQEGWSASHPSHKHHRSVVTWVTPGGKLLTARTFCGAAATSFQPFPLPDHSWSCRKCRSNMDAPFSVLLGPNYDDLLEAYKINEGVGA